jgi:hypothetical protein
VGFGGATGLDYPAVAKVAELLGMRMDRMMLETIQALEAAQLDRWAATAAAAREEARNGR